MRPLCKRSLAQRHKAPCATSSARVCMHSTVQALSTALHQAIGECLSVVRKTWSKAVSAWHALSISCARAMRSVFVVELHCRV